MTETETELTLELRPWLDGRYTFVSLRGTMETIAQPKELRALLNALSLWSGAPVDVVLCVDGTNSGSCWIELWDHVLARIRGRHLYRLRCLISRNTLAPEDGDER